jgi:D-glycerate 3-kinase
MKSFLDSNNSVNKKLFEDTKEDLKGLAQKLKIGSVATKYLIKIVIPLTAFFGSLQKRENPYFICFSGGQGSGKTTLSEFVQLALQKGLNKRTIGFSIDDIYKTREEREELADSIHPLCKVRGVPGTHDIQLGLDTLDALSNAKSSSFTPIPSFSKPLDQHHPEDTWELFEGRPDFIFFDAWCGGTKPVSKENWKPPMNALEKEEDPEGVWSKWSNEELAGDYQILFNRFDLLLMIKVPSMEHVFESRWLQEQTLAKSISDPELKKKIMTKEEVWKFVMHYERLTRYILEEMPSFADIVLERDEDFNFSFVKTPYA